MKVVTATEMALLEQEAFKEGASPDLFMQNAAGGIAAAISDYMRSVSAQKRITLIAGKGNNAGDGFSAAIILMTRGFKVEAFQLYPIEECTPLCQKYAKKFQESGGVIHFIKGSDEFILPLNGIILDGVFGTGFKNEPSEFICDVFNKINEVKVPVFSIDIPSGLEGDSGYVKKAAVKADFTIFLGLPKKGFFIRDGWNYVGHLVHVDFGLDPKFIEKSHFEFEMLTLREVSCLVPEIKRSRHKYQSGFVIGISGCKEMMGASILSGMGALKSGAGIVKLIHLEDEFTNSSVYPELIHKTFKCKQLDEILLFIEKANALYIGPGIGLDLKVEKFLIEFFKTIDKTCVIDADALTLIAQNKIELPKKAILTPHTGEAKRLLNIQDDDIEVLLKASQSYVDEKDVILVLKGAPTFIFSKNQQPFVNITGDPGMATAGSGDVLTGMMAALCSTQDADPLSCAKLAVFLHGKAGEFAAAKNTSFALTATDILKSIHKAWIFLIRSIVQ